MQYEYVKLEMLVEMLSKLNMAAVQASSFKKLSALYRYFCSPDERDREVAMMAVGFEIAPAQFGCLQSLSVCWHLIHHLAVVTIA
jgi:hypothetical protein